MPVLNAAYDVGQIFFATMGAGLLGLLIWWLVRKRQKRLWLPTVRILDMERKILPKLVFRFPPLLAFLCFLFAAIVTVLFSAKPRTLVFTPFEPNQTRIHIFVDMSPSVSAHQSLDAISEKIGALYGTLKVSGRVTLSTSHSKGVSEPADGSQVATQIKSLGFHRPGLRLGNALKEMLDDIGDVDRLFIISDRDQYSWTGFNWKYLLDDMDVIFYDMSDETKAQVENFYISEARYLSAPASSSMDWEIEVARLNSTGEAQGSLTATFMGKELGVFPWNIPNGRNRANISVNWPVTAIGEAGNDSGFTDTPVVMSLKTDAVDLISADNEFRVFLQGAKKDILLIADGNSEQSLDDPTSQFQISLEVLGFKIHRRDFIVQPGPNVGEYPFWVIVGGTGNGHNRYCPTSIELARLQYKNKQGARDGRRRDMPRIWLAPHDLDANYSEMCRCYVRLIRSNDASDPSYCEEVTSRAQWITLLPSLGAKQIGGDYGREDRAVAFSQRDDKSGLEVLAFTIPLKPSRQTGVNHAAMPVLIQDLLRWQGVLESGNKLAARWPRAEDIVETVWRAPTSGDPLELTRVRNSNIPIGESTIASGENIAFPPKWTAQPNWSEKQLASKKDREDPLPWLKLAAFLLASVCLFEALILLVGRFGKSLFRRQELLFLVSALGVLMSSPKVEAGMALHVNSSSLSDGDSYEVLAREVASRTSLELKKKAKVSRVLNSAALSEPWLFSNGVSQLTQPDGRIKPEVATWIKRGGFLVIENQISEQQLTKFTEGLRMAPTDGWMALPPDHEMMRSFYLLDALPDCNNNVWRGYHFDGRLAAIAVPFSLLSVLKDRPSPSPCAVQPDFERSVRVFVNLVMVALATDYKKDQIHLPEILKRLR